MNDLRLIEDFLNTVDERTFSRHGQAHVAGEGLSSPQALSDWLTSHELTATAPATGRSDGRHLAAHRTAAGDRRRRRRHHGAGGSSAAARRGSGGRVADRRPLRLAVAGRHRRDGRDERGTWRLETAQALRRTGLPVGVLRHLPQRSRPVVRHGRLRQSPQDPHLPRATPESPVSHVGDDPTLIPVPAGPPPLPRSRDDLPRPTTGRPDRRPSDHPTTAGGPAAPTAVMRGTSPRGTAAPHR